MKHTVAAPQVSSMVISLSGLVLFLSSWFSLSSCQWHLPPADSITGSQCLHRESCKRYSATSQVLQSLAWFQSIQVLTEGFCRMAYFGWLASFARFRRLSYWRTDSRSLDALSTGHLHPSELARHPLVLGCHCLLRIHQRCCRMAAP